MGSSRFCLGEHIAPLDQHPDRGTFFVVDRYVDERWRTHNVQSFFVQIRPGDRDRLDRLVRRARTDRLDFGAAAFANHARDCARYGTRPRTGGYFENFGVG